MKGRPPKPTRLKELQGNPGGRKPNDKEPKPDIGAKKPPYLSPGAEAHWDRVVPDLEETGLATVVDGDTLASLCQNLADIEENTRIIAAEGRYQDVRGEKKPHPAVLDLRKAQTELRQLSAKFGLTPSDRGRLSVDVQKKPKADAPTPALGKLKAV